jgi:signal transduction histidine kinase
LATIIDQARDLPATARAATAEPSTARRRPMVLVVDDEAEVRQSVHDLLRIDYQVVTRGSGGEALAFLDATPDVAAILTDQRMPEMCGVEVLRRAAAVRPETTRLLFTAYADVSTVVDAVNQGHVFRYIGKPWDPDELQLAIRQAVERRDLIVEKHRLMAELQAANARLTESNRLKSAFLEVASHELNTPVTVILGLADLWKLSQGPTATPAERAWIDRIDSAAGRLARTVGRMFKLVDNGDFSHSLSVETVRLESLIQTALASLAPYLEARAQVVDLQVQADLKPIVCDPAKIHDALINLVANAIKFTPDHKTIRIAAHDDRDVLDSVRVEVQDQGAGVAPEEQPHLFKPFFTGFDTLHHSSGEYQFDKRGIGLGLCLVKTFVALHGGRVEVASTPGQGSTFAFVLPRRQP